MAEQTIMLVCSAGMSTSLLVTKMQKAAEEQGIDAKIFATAASDADDAIASGDISVMMLGPQVRYMLGQFQKKLEGKNIPVEVIDMRQYGMMDGKSVLARAEELIAGK